jgi:hypothetical protein
MCEISCGAFRLLCPDYLYRSDPTQKNAWYGGDTASLPIQRLTDRGEGERSSAGESVGAIGKDF